MKKIYFSAIALCLLMAPSASAWSLFPYYPTYGAGYGGWGAGYAYAPRSFYGYNNYRYAGYGYRGYSYAGYGGFNSACGTCGTCGTAASCSSCNSGCSTCTTTAGYGSWGVSNGFTNACCGTTSPTSTSDKPATDINTDDADRTFAPAGTDATDSTYDDAPVRVDDAAPSGDFSAPSTSSGIDWTKPRNPATSEPAEADSSTEPAPFGTDNTEGSGLIPPKEFDPLNRDTNKPPISNPIDEEGTDAAGEEAPAAEQGSTGSQGSDVDVKDFLSPESSVDRASASRVFRSSHVDVISMPRLAGDSRSVSSHRTLVSSGRQEQRPARWISVPPPNGRIRL